MPNPDEKDIVADNGCTATPATELEHQIMSALVPKNEREWWARGEIERLRAELEKARDGMQNALADAIKDAISDLDDHAGDDLPTRRFLAGAIDGLKKALFIAVSASPVPQNGEG